MIGYHKNNEIDREQYDSCIRNSGTLKPYAWSWYLDIMAPGWEALVDDDYDSVFPVAASRKFGINYIATPVFLQQLGVFSPDKPAEDVIDEYLQYLPDSCRLIDMNMPQKPRSEGFTVSERYNYELDMRKPWDELQKNFTEHCRRNIARAEKSRVSLVDDAGADEMINLFVENKGKEIKGIKQADYLRLRNLMNFCVKNRKGRLLGARDRKGRLFYGMFTVETAKSTTMLLVVNTPESREKRTGYLMVRDLVHARAGSRHVLDFAGSSIPEIAAFMASFGAARTTYYRVYRNMLPWPLRLLK